MQFDSKHYLLISGIFLPVFLIGMFTIPLMEHDATQYATMGMQMLQQKSWLQIYWRTVSYLDKPPLVFWTAAASFAVFDYSHFAYRLPSILVLLLGIYSTYKLGTTYLGETRGLFIPIVFISYLATVLMWLDVRTDTMLTGWIAYSVWQTDSWLNDRKIKHLIGLSVGIGFSLLTKGPIGIMVPLLAFGPDLLFRKKIALFFHKQVWLVPAIIGLMLAPMLIGLYQQHGTEGLAFYFWKQSFGRLTGENVWRDESGPLFFVHTLMWLTLPWTIFLLRGLWILVKDLIRCKLKTGGFLIWGFFLPFIAFSLSQYKLPHYLYVILPFSAIISVFGLTAQPGKALNLFYRMQLVLILFLLLTLLLLNYLLGYTLLLWVCIVVFLAVVATIILKKLQLFDSMVIGSLTLMLLINGFLVFNFYPELLQYQAGSKVAFRMNELYDLRVPRCFYNQHRPAFDFYSKEIVPDFKSYQQIDSALNIHPVWYVFTDKAGVHSLRQRNYELHKMEQFADIKVTQLSLQYLTDTGRKQLADTIYLLRISKTGLDAFH